MTRKRLIARAETFAGLVIVAASVAVALLVTDERDQALQRLISVVVSSMVVHGRRHWVT